MTTIGFIGSGRQGGTVARLAVAAGYDVVRSNSRGPQTLQPSAGKPVLDRINYVPGRDGRIPELYEGPLSSSEVLQRHLRTAHLVKVFPAGRVRLACLRRLERRERVVNEYTDECELRVVIYTTTSETGLGGRRTSHPRSSAREGDLPYVSGHRAVSGGLRSLTKQEPRGVGGPSIWAGETPAERVCRHQHEAEEDTG